MALEPVSFSRTIRSLYRNTVLRSRNMTAKVYWSRLILTPEQSQQLVYPPGFKPLNVFLYQQVDQFDASGQLLTSVLYVIAFMRKDRDPYVYDIYTFLHNQPRFDPRVLVNSRHAITLDPGATFEAENFFEVSQSVNGTAVYLGVSFAPGNPYAFLGYDARGFCRGRSFGNNLHVSGITEIGLRGHTTSFSKNLLPLAHRKHCKKYKQHTHKKHHQEHHRQHS